MLLEYVYLSPHLDDAILSCRGLIYQQRLARRSVAVITLCAGIPDYSQLSPFAQQYHVAWGGLPDPVTSRRAEDSAVLGKWGVTAHHCDTPESIYRRADDEIAYPHVAALFAEPHPQERDNLPRLWQQELESLLSNPAGATIYAPLAAGNHVDHQLVRALALRLINAGWQVWFYEDFTHAKSQGHCKRRRPGSGPHPGKPEQFPLT